MKTLLRLRTAKSMAGAAAVEMAIALPLLLMLAFPVVDFARAIQANAILVAMSREGANLSARGALPLSTDSQTIMYSVASTAPPLDMNTKGMIYITKVIGYLDKGGAKRSAVLEHYRWAKNTAYTPSSTVWACSNWQSGGKCGGISSTPGASTDIDLMRGKLADGELIYVVETFYDFKTIFSSAAFGVSALDGLNRSMYSKAVF